MTPEERARLRELAERATAGPWDAHRPHPAYRQYVVDRVMPEGHLGETVATTEDVQASENAEYIAAVSPDVVLGILDALNAAEAERDRLAAAVERVRALHYAADNDASHTPVCETCHGKAGVHECGCWADEDRVPVCGHCREGHKFVAVPWPCPTIRALDGGGE